MMRTEEMYCPIDRPVCSRNRREMYEGDIWISEASSAVRIRWA